MDLWAEEERSSTNAGSTVQSAGDLHRVKGRRENLAHTNGQGVKATVASQVRDDDGLGQNVNSEVSEKW